MGKFYIIHSTYNLLSNFITTLVGTNGIVASTKEEEVLTIRDKYHVHWASWVQKVDGEIIYSIQFCRFMVVTMIEVCLIIPFLLSYVKHFSIGVSK